MYSTVHQNDDIGNKIFIGSRGMSYKDDTQLHRVGVRHVQSCSGRECQQLNCNSRLDRSNPHSAWFPWLQTSWRDSG